MKRRASGIDFAIVWGKVSRWGQQDQEDLISLIEGRSTMKVPEPKKREPRKPRGGPAELDKP